MKLGNRRDFLKQSVGGAALAGSAASVSANEAKNSAPLAGSPRKKPNIVLYLADEFRGDFIGAAGANSCVRTPNLDRIAQRGVIFTHAVTNQPLCSPSRACMLTGRYATETGVWKLEVDMRRDLPTLATLLREQGYTANLIGKWHLAKANVKAGAGFGWVEPDLRGGFLDVWEGANVLERTTHPYYGTIWDREGKEISFKDQYRVDFLTDRAVRFLEQPHEKPFLLYISQLEPHFQNDLNTVIGPKGMADKYQNPIVPGDLSSLPGVWQQQLPDYYAAIERIDQSVGRIVETLEKQNLLDDTIFLFTSDHGCHFGTRENNYKRTPHDSSIRIPMLLAGPGVRANRRVGSIAGNINITPTLLDLCGLQAPASMKGRSMDSLINSLDGEAAWKNYELIQFSQTNNTGMGRAVRTADWTYSIANPTGGSEAPFATSYTEYVMFNNAEDPCQLLNLAGRRQYKEKSEELRKLLKELIAYSGDPVPEINSARLFYP